MYPAKAAAERLPPTRAHRSACSHLLGGCNSRSLFCFFGHSPAVRYRTPLESTLTRTSGSFISPARQNKGYYSFFFFLRRLIEKRFYRIVPYISLNLPMQRLRHAVSHIIMGPSRLQGLSPVRL
eukprot:765299-Hanusia_phi.AAC.4